MPRLRTDLGWLNEASRFGIPFRLTLQQQAAGDVLPEPADVFVCENPAVLRIAASDLGADCPPLVCTEGMPSAACHKLLSSATAQGARLHWRADFDWTGRARLLHQHPNPGNTPAAG